MARAVRAILGQDHRYAHVLAVARTGARFAAVHGLDVDAARTAGLLHDLARLWPMERLLADADRRGLSIDPFERANPIVLHARISAELARERFGIDDERVLSAIRKHTVADIAMGPLDIVVYLADALEPGRSFAGRAQLFALALRDLDGALRAVIASTIDYLRGRRLQVAPQTLALARTLGVGDREEKRPA